MEHIFIINPQAGKKKALTLVPYIKSHYEKPLILLTEYKGHAAELAKTYAGEETVLYSVGGDGTLNEVVNGVARSAFSKETLVAAVPYGSGNDFLKGLTGLKDPMAILERYQAMRIKEVDLGKINGHYFINVASVGFDAMIVHNARRFKRIPLVQGELAYLISVLSTLLYLKCHQVIFRPGHGTAERQEVLMVILANGKYYGGGMMPAPQAVLDDGLLDFCVVSRLPRRKVLRLLPRFIKGNHTDLDEVTMIKGKKISIESACEMPVNIDGEILWERHFRVQIKERSMRILLP